MQIYQGVDIVEITKFKKVFQRKDQLISDIFSSREKEYCFPMKNKYSHFAGRFAAKEAYLKALGGGLLGWGAYHVFQEIEIIPEASGKPTLSLSGWAENIAKKRRITQFTVSISHSSNYAVATVILAGKPKEEICDI
jgi:holo-[acyl-carrier protein] synthase